MFTANRRFQYVFACFLEFMKRKRSDVSGKKNNSKIPSTLRKVVRKPDSSIVKSTDTREKEPTVLRWEPRLYTIYDPVTKEKFAHEVMLQWVSDICRLPNTPNSVFQLELKNAKRVWPRLLAWIYGEYAATLVSDVEPLERFAQWEEILFAVTRYFPILFNWCINYWEVNFKLHPTLAPRALTVLGNPHSEVFDRKLPCFCSPTYESTWYQKAQLSCASSLITSLGQQGPHERMELIDTIIRSIVDAKPVHLPSALLQFFRHVYRIAFFQYRLYWYNLWDEVKDCKTTNQLVAIPLRLFAAVCDSKATLQTKPIWIDKLVDPEVPDLLGLCEMETSVYGIHAIWLETWAALLIQDSRFERRTSSSEKWRILLAEVAARIIKILLVHANTNANANANAEIEKFMDFLCPDLSLLFADELLKFVDPLVPTDIGVSLCSRLLPQRYNAWKRNPIWYHSVLLDKLCAGPHKCPEVVLETNDKKSMACFELSEGQANNARILALCGGAQTNTENKLIRSWQATWLRPAITKEMYRRTCLDVLLEMGSAVITLPLLTNLTSLIAAIKFPLFDRHDESWEVLVKLYRRLTEPYNQTIESKLDGFDNGRFACCETIHSRLLNDHTRFIGQMSITGIPKDDVFTLQLDKHVDFYKRWVSSQRSPMAHKHSVIENTQRDQQANISRNQRLTKISPAGFPVLLECVRLFCEFQRTPQWHDRLDILRQKECSFYRHLSVGQVVEYKFPEGWGFAEVHAVPTEAQTGCIARYATQMTVAVTWGSLGTHNLLPLGTTLPFHRLLISSAISKADYATATTLAARLK